MNAWKPSQKELNRRCKLVKNARDMICSVLPIEEGEEQMLISGYRDCYLQISFSMMHPLMVICLARQMKYPSTTKQYRQVNELNLQSILGSYAINDEVGCYAYRATQWLDAELDATRFFEILDRCVDEAERGFYRLAGSVCSYPPD